MPRDYEAEVDRLIALISGKELDRAHPTYQRCLQWLGFWPADLSLEKRQRLFEVICTSYSTTKEQLLADVAAGHAVAASPEFSEAADEDELRSVLPHGGWFEWYDEFTKSVESPLSFSIFSSLVVLGAAIGRAAWVDMAHWRIYPNCCAILVGPTGRVKKTTAVDIGKKLLLETSLCPIMSDKITPEAFISVLQKNGGHQFVYAPEFSILFNKQRYNDGFVTAIIRMLDCPDTFVTTTQTRGEQEVHGVCLSILGGSTLSLLASSSPTEVLSSGFLNRFLVIVENSTDRCFPWPDKGTPELEVKLRRQLERMKTFTGAFTVSPAARSFYETWYRQRSTYLRNAPSEMVAELLERTPTHLLRIALLIHAVQCDDQLICSTCLEHAAAMLSYVERRIPTLVDSISQSVGAQDTSFILSILERNKGTMDHSTLLRRVAHRMNATMFKSHIATLAESGQIAVQERGKLRLYVIPHLEKTL